MAGYVKLQRAVWQDQDYTALPAGPQRLYLLLISQPTISHVGVLAYTPGRWATLAADTTAEDMAAALDTLEAHGYVLVDRDTEEVWVRTYMHHDELHRVHNGRKALEKAAGQVHSVPLREAVTTAMSTLSGPPPVAPPQGGGGGGPVLQQPADSSLQTADSSAHRPVGAADLPPAAAAAIDAYIRHRTDTTQPRNPAGFRRTLERQAPAELGPALLGALGARPDAQPEWLCRTVLGMSELDCWRLGLSRAVV